MSPNELVARETKEWLGKALDDLGCARVLAGASHEAGALYHFQQSAEKSLKAFLTWHDQPFRKTHNLKELGDACTTLDPSLETITASAHALTDYAWKLRYPGDPYVIEDGETAAMVELAANVLAEVQTRLPSPIRTE